MISKAVKIAPETVTMITTIVYLSLALIFLARVPDFYPTLIHFPDRFQFFIHPGYKWDFADARPLNLERIGYDGQFFYDQARTFFHADTVIDNPPYRTARMLYPLLVFLLSLGQTATIPVVMLLVNLAAVIAATYLLAGIFKSLNKSPWWALGYAFWPGTVCACFYDLSEPLCFLLIIAAFKLYLNMEGKAWQIGGLLLLASLTKELALIFGAGWLLYWLWQKDFTKSAQLVLSWLVPYSLWQLFLIWNFGRDGLSAGHSFSFIPLGGFWQAQVFFPPVTERIAITLASVLPVLWALGLLLKSRFFKDKSPFSKLLLPLLSLEIAFLLFLPKESYIYLVDHSRNATGLIVVLYLLPENIYGKLQKYQLFMSIVLSIYVVATLLNTGNAFL